MELLNRKQAAEYLGLSYQTLANWQSNKKVNLPTIRIGRAVRYRRSDLDEYLKSKTVNPVEGV